MQDQHFQSLERIPSAAVPCCNIEAEVEEVEMEEVEMEEILGLEDLENLEDPEDLSTAVVSQYSSSILHLTQVDDSMAERIKDLPKRRKRVNR